MQSDQYKNRGGARDGAGRPKSEPKPDKKENITLRVTPEQKGKLIKLGGAKWIREKIDEASA